MIIVDTALRAREAEGNPVRVALVGAGFMAQGLANQIANSVRAIAATSVSMCPASASNASEFVSQPPTASAIM